MHYYSHNIADYRKDTLGLTLIEHGAYRQLLDQYYLDEKPLPKDDDTLYRLVNARNQDEKYAVRYAIKSFFTETEDGYVHGRCETTIKAYQKTRINNSKAGKASALKAKLRKEMATSVEQPINQPINQEPLTKNNKQVVSKPEGIDDTLWSDYMKVRKAKGAPITETALKAIVREADKAGKSLSQAITLCVENNWVGFKADWDSVKSMPNDTPKKWPGK